MPNDAPILNPSSSPVLHADEAPFDAQLWEAIDPESANRFRVLPFRRLPTKLAFLTDQLITAVEDRQEKQTALAYWLGRESVVLKTIHDADVMVSQSEFDAQLDDWYGHLDMPELLSNPVASELRLRILWLDGNTQRAEHWRRMFERTGFLKVDHAPNLARALQLVAKKGNMLRAIVVDALTDNEMVQLKNVGMGALSIPIREIAEIEKMDDPVGAIMLLGAGS